MASSSSSSSPSPPTSLLRPHQFTPIQECEREDQDDDQYSIISENKTTPSGISDKRLTPKQQHNLTPLREKTIKAIKKPRHHEDHDGASSVSCNKCRPNTREKISVVPLDHNNNGLHKLSSSTPSPNGLFKSLFSSLTRKSPKSSSGSLDHFSASREEQWKIAIAELSHKLIQATRKRDEAVLEASRLKHSMSELERKLNKLELYCHNLKSGLDECSGNSPYQGKIFNSGSNNSGGSVTERVIEQFLVSVSEARSSVRVLSRALTMQMRHMGGRVYERVSLLLQPYDIKISFPRNPKSVLFYLEALLNKALFEDFESVGFKKSSCNQILNPIDRCEANYAMYNVLKELAWEEVLSKGTRNFSEEFSKFCDRKMNDIVAMLGWNRAWPEQLLQAFFNAAKSAWLVHALANSVHPGLVIFRVDKEASFDSIYMEDMGGDRAQSLVPTVVRIMVAPGFYVYGNVVKCKVLCRYYNNNNMSSTSTCKDKVLFRTP